MAKKYKHRHYNSPQPLMEELAALVGDKKKIKLVDIGGGPFPVTGELLDGVEVELHLTDKRDYSKSWEDRGLVPRIPVEYQNMEELTFPDNEFDIVHCQNALDHTVNAPTAVREMIRICKPGGWVYIKCWLMQKEAHRKMHYWNAIEDGSFYNDTDRFDLKDFGFKVKFSDNGGDRDHNFIVAKLNK